MVLVQLSQTERQLLVLVFSWHLVQLHAISNCVSSVVCDLAGDSSSPQVKIIPSYSSDSQALKMLFIVVIVNQTVSACMPWIHLIELFVSVIQHCQFLISFVIIKYLCTLGMIAPPSLPSTWSINIIIGGSILSIQFIQEDFFNISGNISGSPTTFSAHVSNLVNGSSFNSTVGLSSQCEEDSGCPIDLPNSSYCS